MVFMVAVLRRVQVFCFGFVVAGLCALLGGLLASHSGAVDVAEIPSWVSFNGD